MGAQSILQKDICSIRQDSDKKLLSHAKEYILKKRFDVGERCNKKTITKHLLIDTIIYSDNCEVLDYINTNMVYENIFTQVRYKTCECKDKEQTTNQPEVFQSDFSSEFQ